MKTLEACYEFEISKINFLERKIKITHPKTILKGPPKSGKTYLIYDFLGNLNPKDYLYIDFSDLRNNKQDIENDLERFIKVNSIKTLVLENFNFDIKLPICENIIITSNLDGNLFGFKTLNIMPLDFEEFLLHDNKHQNITNSFNYFLKYGNLSEIINLDENKKIRRMQEILMLNTQDRVEREILKLLFESIDEKKSIFQLFNVIKKEYKISKDRFYNLCQRYENNLIIFFIEKYNQPNSSKKLYSYNHAFSNIISHNKKFKNEFTNMIFLELLREKRKIYYLDFVDFYIPESKKLILSIPFFNDLILVQIKRKLSLTIKEVDAKKVEIITIGNNSSFEIENLTCTVLPFYEWAVI